MQSVVAFDPTAPGAAAAALLCAARVGGLMLVAPVFSSQTTPKLMRVGMLVIFAALLTPIAFAARPAASVTAATLASETLIGAAIGLGAAILVAAAETAGDVMAVQMGLSGSAILNPLDMSQVPVLGVFCQMFAVTVLLSFNLHHDMLRALADSLAALPVGSSIAAENGLGAMVQLGSALFMFGVRFAAPVIAVILVVNIALALLGKAAPQLNLLTVSFPVQIAVGLIAFGAVLPAIARSLAGAGGWYRESIIHVGGALAATAR
jgi:flagellar biosynthetic protein FliR